MSGSGRKRKRGEKHPYLTGNFAPVNRTHAATACTFTGTIPDELLGGQYVRNGGNPVSNEDLGRDAHWFDGDGMLAGVTFQRSQEKKQHVQPYFVNQYILTDLCLSNLENPSIRTPILPSIATLVNPISTLVVIISRIFRTFLLVALSHLPGKHHAIKKISVANTGLYFHDGRALATCESGPPMRVQLPSLETVGWYDGNRAEGESDSLTKAPVFGGGGLLHFMKEWATGHPKVDPETGEMILFHCNFLAPYVHYSVIPATYQKSSEKMSLPRLLNLPVPDVSGAKMMHDFGVSRTHTVIMDLPLSLDPLNLIKNKPIVSYDPSKPSRFGVFPRQDPSKVRWFETSACCIFHTANTWDAYDESGKVIAVHLLACRLTSASLVYSAGNVPVPQNAKSPRKPMSFFARYDDDEIVSKDSSPRRPSKLIDPEDYPDPELLPLQVEPATSYEEDLQEDEQCRLYHYTFSLNSRSSRPEITAQYALSAVPFEFPTLNPSYEMSAAHYIYGCTTSENSFSTALGRATQIDVLVKIDAHTLIKRASDHPPTSITGCVDTRSVPEILATNDSNDSIRCFKMPKGWYAQEARFVSRSNPSSEDDGYLLFYAFDESQLDEEGECLPDAVSELWILDAKNFRDVVGKVKLPQRVPYGLHGNWFTEDMIKGQRAVERVREVPGVMSEERSLWAEAKRRLIAAVG